MISAYHISDTGQSTFCRLFIFHNDLMRGRLVSCPPTKMTRLREARDCQSHSRKQCSWALNPAAWLHSPASLPRLGMGLHPRILSLEGRSAHFRLSVPSPFTKVALPTSQETLSSPSVPSRGMSWWDQGSARVFWDGSVAWSFIIRTSKLWIKYKYLANIHLYHSKD